MAPASKGTTLSESSSFVTVSAAAAPHEGNVRPPGSKKTIQQDLQIDDGSERHAEISDRLTSQEVRAFRQVVSDWDDMTPRQLRIFYYRYLLLKHLLLKYYEKLPDMNPWTTGPAVSALLIFLRRYSGYEGQEKLTQDKKHVNAHSFDTYIPLISTHSDQTFQRKHMLVLFEFIDLVVAY